MRARLAVGIAAVLAVAILLPVAVVVALGAYGSSLGGATVATGPGNAELLVFPSHGLPGSSLKVTGKHWPPRSNVAIQLQRPSAGSDSPSKPLRLAEIITSRRGTFEIDTTIPGSVIPFGTESVRIQAVGRKSSQPDAAVLSVPFDLDPYPNEVTISVVDADTGAASPEAIVRIDDSFGQEIAVETSSATGDVLFAGIRPGKKRLTIRKIDYEIARASIEVPDAGQAAFQIALQKSPGRRLLFYAYGLSDTGETTLVGLDRASGLPVRERITVPAGRFAPASVPSWNLYQGFFLAVDQDSGAISARAGDMDSLWALGAVGQWMLSIRQGMWVGIWHSYLGRSTIGDVVDSRASNQLSAPGSHLYIVDPDSGQIVFRRRVARYFLPPVLSPTKSRLYPRQLGWTLRRLSRPANQGAVDNSGSSSYDRHRSDRRSRRRYESHSLRSGRIGLQTTHHYRGGLRDLRKPRRAGYRRRHQRWETHDVGLSLTRAGCFEPGNRADRSGHSASFAHGLDTGRPIGTVHIRGDPGLAQ